MAEEVMELEIAEEAEEEEEKKEAPEVEAVPMAGGGLKIVLESPKISIQKLILKKKE